MAVRINRGERRAPYLSNIVKGGATQVTPNGTAYDTEPKPETADGIVGAESETTIYAPFGWPSGNRSGE